MKLAPPRPERADAAPETKTGLSETAIRWPASPPGLRRPPGRRRTAVLLKALAILFAVVGVLALADGVLTLVWQEPISGLLAHFEQARLAQNLKRLEGERATPADERALAALPTDGQRMAFFARRLRQSAQAGQAVGRIRIPRIGANFVVVAGTDESSLQKGPGIYAGTAVPGLRGTVGIAGHRTTYLAPFRRINELEPGDRITLEMPYGLFSYTVLGHKIVSPNDVSVLRTAPYDQVVLTACNPLYSAAQRIVVFARLTAAAPSGPALTSVGAGLPQPPISAAQGAQAILGDPVADGLVPTGAPPQIDAGQVVIGRAALGVGQAPAGHQKAPARAGVRATPAAPARIQAASPAPRVSTPPPARAPAVTAPRPPVSPAPRAPSRPIVRTPAAPKPIRPPTAKAPPSPATSPTVTIQSQTRVQGKPGASAPIIGVSTG